MMTMADGVFLRLLKRRLWTLVADRTLPRRRADSQPMSPSGRLIGGFGAGWWGRMPKTLANISRLVADRRARLSPTGWNERG